MADTKVSGLAGVAAFATTLEIPVNDSGTSHKMTGTQLQAGWRTVTYKARAYLNVNYSMAVSGNWIKIPLDTKTYDLNTNFDVATNHYWTCPLAGYYYMTGAVQHAATTGRVGARFSKNAATILASALLPPHATGNTSVQVADIQSLALNDTIELQGFQESGGAANAVSGTSSTFLVIHFMSL